MTCAASLPYTTQEHLPGGGTAHSGMNPPKSFIHQENAPQNAHRPAWWRQSLSWGSLSPGDSSLWQTDSWVWQTTLKPSLSVLRARLHSSNVFHACAMAGLIKSPSQSCLWILRYILCSPWPLDIWPSRMYTLKTSTIFFKKGSHFLVFFFFLLPTLQFEALDTCGGRSTIQHNSTTALWTEHSIRSRWHYEQSYPGSV